MNMDMHDANYKATLFYQFLVLPNKSGTCLYVYVFESKFEMLHS